MWFAPKFQRRLQGLRFLSPYVAGSMQSEWDQMLEWAADEGDVPRWTGKAVWQTCDAAVDFYTRIRVPHFLGCSLTYRPYDEYCSHRQECAADLVAMAELASVDELGYDQRVTDHSSNWHDFFALASDDGGC